jgi:hypothetical protein
LKINKLTQTVKSVTSLLLGIDTTTIYFYRTLKHISNQYNTPTIMDNPFEKKPVFSGDEGKIILSSEAKKIKDVHQRKKDAIIKTGDNYVEAEFFGMNRFKELIAPYGDQCVGFRVYYGNTLETHKDGKATVDAKGKNTSRLVIVAVDKFGNDLRPELAHKDPTPSALTNGPLCPSTCQEQSN